MKKRVIGFLIISFVIAWAMWLAIYFMGIELSNTIANSIISLTMFAPAAAVVLLKVIDGPKPVLMVSFAPKIKGNVTWYLLAILIPFIMSVLGAMLYFLVFSDQLDLTMSYLRSTYEQTMPGVEVDASVLKIGAISAIISCATIAPIINMFFAFGEEVGWRGFLYPALSKKFTPVKASIIVGIIWGLWHTPINMMGYNYGTEYPGFPWLGIVAMCMFCFASSVVLTWFTEKTGSIWPAALAHGSINAGGSVAIMFIKASSEYNQLLGPQISGIIATIPMLILAIVLLIVKSRSAEEEEFEGEEISNESSYESLE